jgi:hypothetical protein
MQRSYLLCAALAALGAALCSTACGDDSATADASSSSGGAGGAGASGGSGTTGGSGGGGEVSCAGDWGTPQALLVETSGATIQSLAITQNELVLYYYFLPQPDGVGDVPSAARKRAMLRGSVTMATSFILPLHAGHSSTSSANVRRSSSAQGR